MSPQDDRAFIIEVISESVKAGVKSTHLVDIINRLYASGQADKLGRVSTFLEQLRGTAPDFFAEAAQPAPAPLPSTKKPLPAEAFRDSGGIIRLTREQALDVSIYRKARAEAERTGKVLDIAE